MYYIKKNRANLETLASHEENPGSSKSGTVHEQRSCGKGGIHQEIVGYLRAHRGISWIAREHQERLGNRRENTEEKWERWETSENIGNDQVTPGKDTLAKVTGGNIKVAEGHWEAPDTHCGTLGNIKER